MTVALGLNQPVSVRQRISGTGTIVLLTSVLSRLEWKVGTGNFPGAGASRPCSQGAGWFCGYTHR